MLAGEGLRPSSKGVRIDYTGPSPRVVDGPFAEAKELVAGFWILQTRDQDEAVEWLRLQHPGSGRPRPRHRPPRAR